MKTTTKKEAGMRNWKPAEVFHPGEILRDELDERGWSQIEFAEIIERPYQTVNEIIMGKKGITPETAKALGAALGTSAQLWMNLDSAYKLNHADEVSSRVAHRAKLWGIYPVREMLRRTWVQTSDDVEVLESRLLRYFEISSLEDTPKLAYAPKKTGDSDETSPIQWAWLYRVKHIAEAMQVPPYSKKTLSMALSQLAVYLGASEEIRHVPQVLEKCGVRLVIVEPFSGSQIDGACFWLDSNSPVIGLSLRLDRIDNFWYVLRHEIEHVLNGDGKDGIAMIDSGQEKLRKDDLPEPEKLAHAAAAEFCTPQNRLDNFLARVGPFPSRNRVILFAKTLGIHPGVVVGQIQRRLDRYDLFRPMLISVKETITPVAMTDGYGQVLPVEI